nr:hypothetical protein [uncultured Lichenicoccus sp.]
MKFTISATAAVAMLVAAPAIAAPGDAPTDATPMHHHHNHHMMMHGKHHMMSKGSGDAEVEKLNEQSLQNAKAGAVPATSGTSTTAPGTGMSMPTSASGATGAMTPGNAPGAAPMNAPAATPDASTPPK